MLTLKAAATRGAVRSPLVEPYWCRTIVPADTQALGELYYASYPPGVAGAAVEEAIEDIRATFDGEYGKLMPQASLVAVADGRLAAAVMTVHRAPWPDTPDCPFIIELFTAPDHRRRGLGRHLIERVLSAVTRTDRSYAALRVATDNTAAITLYESLGFTAVRTKPR